MTEQASMSLLAHLNELRNRLIRIFVALVFATAISLFFTKPLLKLLIAPYGSPLKVIGPTESVSIYLRVSLTAGGILAMPYILWEAWGFIAPGLLPHERRYVYLFVPVTTTLFLVGVAFAWFIMVPAALGFLAGFAPDIFQTEWISEKYIPFVTSLLFWIGVSFETPLVVFFLARLRLVSAGQLLRLWRHAVVVIAIIAAIITPTVDPFNMALVMGPLIALYFVSILLAALA